MTSAPPVKKACDACHRRKVRCSGSVPCKNCGQANLQCTYLAIPQKKGPKGSRAKVISEIRDTQLQKPPVPKAAVSHLTESDYEYPTLNGTGPHSYRPSCVGAACYDGCRITQPSKSALSWNPVLSSPGLLKSMHAVDSDGDEDMEVHTMSCESCNTPGFPTESIKVGRWPGV